MLKEEVDDLRNDVHDLFGCCSKDNGGDFCSRESMEDSWGNDSYDEKFKPRLTRRESSRFGFVPMTAHATVIGNGAAASSAVPTFCLNLHELCAMGLNNLSGFAHM